MAVHEFGILPAAPQPGQSFERYEPERYSCISVEDIFLEPFFPELAKERFFWHSLDRPGPGLAETGITLLPPDTLAGCLDALPEREELAELRALLLKAKAGQNYVIHFGL